MLFRSVQPKLFPTLGGRYTTETRWFSQSNNGVLLVDDVSKSFNKFNYKVGVRYEVTDKTNVYATYSTAFKSGVYNMAATGGTPVNPENIKAAEFGIKSDPLDWLRTNLAVYYYDYKDLQLQSKAPTGPGYILQNAANAEIYGGEFETIISPVRDLRLRAAVAYTHARYKDFPNAQGFTPIVNGNGDFAGNVAAPALIMYEWALKSLGRLGWIAAFLYCAAAALRLARFNTNIEVVDKRFFQGLPSPAAAALCAGLIWVIDDFQIARADVIIGIACAITVFAGITMVSNLPFYSFKTFNLRRSVPFWAILLIVLAMIVISSNPPMTLFLLFVGYSFSGYFLWAWRRWRKIGQP